MGEDVVRSEAEGIIELRLNRPEKKNALTSDMYRALIAGLEEATSRADIGAVLIASNGDAFSAGNDIQDFLRGPEGGSAAFDFIRTIAAYDKPIVAAVQGLAVGVGTTMLFHCDLVYAAPTARFTMPFVNLGILPEAGASLLAPATLGYAKAAAMLMLGEPLDADGADRAGLVTGIVPAEDLIAHARAKAIALTRKPPMALAETRRLMRGNRSLLDARITEEAELFRRAMQSDEAKEAFSAFLEKRAPVFAREGAK